MSGKAHGAPFIPALVAVGMAMACSSQAPVRVTPAALTTATVAPVEELPRTVQYASRPRVELVPDACRWLSNEFWRTHACVHDGPLTRATRRITGAEHVASARVGASVFVLRDPHEGVRFDAALLEWNLNTDEFEELASSGFDNLVDVGFGALVGRSSVGDVGSAPSGVHAEIIRAGEPPLSVDAGLLHARIEVSGGVTYVVQKGGATILVSRLDLESDALRSTPLVEFDARDTWFSSSDQPLRAIRVWRGMAELWEPPFVEPRRVNAGRTGLLRSVGFTRGHAELWSARRLTRIDLATFAVEVSRATNAVLDLDESVFQRAPDSLLRAGFDGGAFIVPDAVVSAFRLEAAGVFEHPGYPCERCGVFRPCAPEDELRICGPANREMERIARVERAGYPPVSFSGDHRFQAERVEDDYIRLTRLEDGVCLWVRVIMSNLFVQADDGAFQAFIHSMAPLPWDHVYMPRITVRQGASTLEAPVDSLTSVRDRYWREGLVEAFFSGQPLPEVLP